MRTQFQRLRKFECGSYLVAGQIKSKPGLCGHKRLMCSSLRCTVCQKARLSAVRAHVSEIAEQHQLRQFVTLTLDPAKVGHPSRSDRYIRNCWRKMRVVLQRRFGESVAFFAVLEFQKSGYAHLHVLISIQISRDWLSEAWQSIGGGRIVDIRTVDVHRVSAYLTCYLAGSKIIDTLMRLPLRARIFSTSRGLSLKPRRPKTGWWLAKTSMEAAHVFCVNPSSERFASLGAIRRALMYFEGLPSVAIMGDMDVIPMLRRLFKFGGDVQPISAP
jgi:hypothetical protein